MSGADAATAADTSRQARLAQLDAQHAEQTEAAQGFMDAGFQAEPEPELRQSPDERLAQLEAKLSQLRGLSSFLASLPQQGSHERPAEAAPEAPDEPDPRVLIAQWQSFDADMSERLRDAFVRRREIDRSVEELESQLRFSDEATTRLQSEMMAMADEVEGWASSASDPNAWDAEDQVGAADAQPRNQTPSMPLAEDVLGEIVMQHMGGAELSALACTCYALAARADEIFEQRVLHMLATDKFGAPVVGTASAPASVCAAFTSGAFPIARIGEDDAEEAEQTEIRVQLQRGWRRMFRVLHFAWMPPDDSAGYACTDPIVAALLPSAPDLEGLVGAVLAAQKESPEDALEHMDAVEDFCAAQAEAAAAAQASAQEASSAAATAWLAVLLRHQTLRFRWLATRAGRGFTDTVAARLMRAVTTGRLATHVRSAAEAVTATTDDCTVNVSSNSMRGVETAMVSELLARLAERELFQCLGLSWAARENAAAGNPAAQAMVGVGLRELGSLYHNWGTWTSCVDDDDDGTEEEQSEPQPEHAQRRVRVASATACEKAVRSIASTLARPSAQESVIELIAAEPTLYSRWVRSEEGWSAPRVEELKQRGNAAFRQKDFETALQLYRDALELCDQAMVGGTTATTTASKESELSPVLSLLDELERDCLLNCAAASLQLQDASSAAACCDAAIAIDPSHPKAFYRRAQAYAALRKRTRALADYEMAATLAPRNVAITKAYKAAKQEALERQNARRRQRSQEAEASAGGVE